MSAESMVVLSAENETETETESGSYSRPKCGKETRRNICPVQRHSQSQLNSSNSSMRTRLPRGRAKVGHGKGILSSMPRRLVLWLTFCDHRKYSSRHAETESGTTTFGPWDEHFLELTARTSATNHFNRPFQALSKNVFIPVDIALSALETFLFSGLYKFTLLTYLITFGRNRMSTESVHFPTFGAKTETETEIRLTSKCQKTS